MKTLIGKNDYLFLQNDTNKELEVHTNNLCLVSDDFYKRLEKYLHKYLLIVFPDKSLVHNRYLPEGLDAKYRPGVEKYNEYLKDHILDLYPYLKEEDTYYKTDTHMNLKGATIAYDKVLEKITSLFGLNIEKKVAIQLQKKECVLTDLHLALGDLTTEENLGGQTLSNKMDTYFFSDDVEGILYLYPLKEKDEKMYILDYHLNDCTKQYVGNVIDWNIISNYVIYSKNEEIKEKKKIVIVYDSFLLSTLSVWMQTFSDIYFIKDKFNIELIERINPDYIFEFRVERFLC
jgi:hypothetical protein